MAVIGGGEPVTRFGPLPGSDASGTVIGGSSNSQRPMAVGSVVPVALSVSDSGINETDEVRAAIKAPFDGELVSLSHSNKSVTATASFEIYNSTTSTSILNDTALTSGASALVNTFDGETTFTKGDVIQVRMTTNGTGVTSGFSVALVLQASAAPGV